MVDVHKFKPRDQVKHRFGGPWMTIKSVAGDDIICGWLDDKMESNEKAFKAKELRFTTNRRLFNFG